MVSAWAGAHPASQPLRLRAGHLAQMIAHAAAGEDEVCGVLIGRRAPQLTLSSVVAARNLHPTPRRNFTLDAATLLQTDSAARAIGAEIIGFYHSHPGGTSVPSTHDRCDAWPGFVMMIISVQPLQRAYVGAWMIAGNFVQPLAIALAPA